MTRAKERLIVAGSIDREKTADASTPIGWVLDRLEADEELSANGNGPVEIERGDARLVVRVDRHREGDWLETPAAVAAEPEAGQLALFTAPEDVAAVAAPELPPLVPPPEPPLHRVRRLSFTALSTFEQCSYKYFTLRVAGMSERRPERAGAGDGEGGLRATEVGDAVHRLLEQVDLNAPAAPDVEQVREWYPGVTEEELERIRVFVSSYCDSELAARIAALPRIAKERHFTFEHDGVLLHGYLDALHLDRPRALVLDYKTNVLGDRSPDEIVDADYRLQRLVYALACFRAGADEVEVVYHFLERPDAIAATTFGLDQVAELEAELSEAIARIHAGEFRPTPSDYACSGCPALDLVCAGPRLHGGGDPFGAPFEPTLASA
jgi:ATP-dependent exoDNAse (exonuclease V) beta subunit